jgi:hypothetical protein
MVTYLPLMAASDERKPVTSCSPTFPISGQLPVSPWSIDHISAVTLAERDMRKSVTLCQKRGLDISYGAFGGGTTGQEPAGFLEQVGLKMAGVALNKVSGPLPFASPHSDPASSWSGGARDHSGVPMGRQSWH